MVFRRKLNFKKFFFRIILPLFLIYLLFHLDNIGKSFCPIAYQNVIFQEAESQDMDPYLLSAVIKTESNFDPNALSPKGAMGMMQIMPSTGEWIAEKSKIGGFSEANLYNPNYNIKLGSWYLNHLYVEFDNNYTLMLAAYNGGRTNVRNWLNEGVWDGEKDTIEQIPFPETRNFVKKVYLYQNIYHLIYR